MICKLFHRNNICNLKRLMFHQLVTKNNGKKERSHRMQKTEGHFICAQIQVSNGTKKNGLEWQFLWLWHKQLFFFFSWWHVTSGMMFWIFTPLCKNLLQNRKLSFFISQLHAFNRKTLRMQNLHVTFKTFLVSCGTYRSSTGRYPILPVTLWQQLQPSRRRLMIEHFSSITWFCPRSFGGKECNKWEAPLPRTYRSTWSIQAVKRLCPCEDGERWDTELEHSFSLFFLWPICTMVWCRICCWQIYNWCTLCCYAALQATVLQPTSSWFSLSAPSRCGEYLYSHRKWKIHYSRPIWNFYTHVKFNFLPSHIQTYHQISRPGAWLWVSWLTFTHSAVVLLLLQPPLLLLLLTLLLFWLILQLL